MTRSAVLTAVPLLLLLSACAASPGDPPPADGPPAAEAIDCEARATEFGRDLLDPADLPEPYADMVGKTPDCLFLAEPGKYIAEWHGPSDEEITQLIDEIRAAAAADGLEHTFGEDGQDELWSAVRGGNIDSIMMGNSSTTIFELETDYNSGT